jgi:hypothetical protein
VLICRLRQSSSRIPLATTALVSSVSLTCYVVAHFEANTSSSSSSPIDAGSWLAYPESVAPRYSSSRVSFIRTVWRLNAMSSAVVGKK